MSASKHQYGRWVLLQFCAGVLACGLWVFLRTPGLVSDQYDIDAAGRAPDDAGPFLGFLIFRAVPAFLALLVLLVGEWLFLKLRAAGRE